MITREELNAQDSAPRDIAGLHEPIAITGIGCRFPGAEGVEAFWQLLVEGVDAIGEIPSDRFSIDDLYDPRPQTPGKLSTTYMGSLPDVSAFDPYFFGISPREAMRMDPQHRIALEVSWAALEDAGLRRDEIVGSLTGVFLGICTDEYSTAVELGDHLQELDIYVVTGTSRSVASGRIAYCLDLRGPTISVDAACASSLLAIHLACQSIRSGECAMAVAGGVGAILLSDASLCFSRSGMLAADGHCKFGDASADGFVRSDGAGMIVLKTLSRAQADGDRIYAVIRGGATNNDGQGSGFMTTPSRVGQEASLRAAYGVSGIDPLQVSYVEAHGTGTIAGDPVEIDALSAVLCAGRDFDRPLITGSVKTNIGHTEAAAGVAGVIKVALALYHRAIPPSLHFKTPNPSIPWSTLPLRIATELQPWPARDGEIRTAGVNSFGISGTNAHMILQEAPAAAPQHTPAATGRVLTLSAQTRNGLADLARAHSDALMNINAGSAFDNWCYTAAIRRTHQRHRLALVAETPLEASELLREVVAASTSVPGVFQGALKERAPKVVWLFSGNGGQWIGMALELLDREPAFRRSMEECDEAIAHELGWSLIERLANLRQEDLDANQVMAPIIFAMQVSFAALWRAYGVTPDAVVGHSMGEIAASHVAGALSLQDAARVVCRRSAIVSRAARRGGMLLVELAEDQVRSALATYEGLLSVAAINSPTSTIVAGDEVAINSLARHLDERNVFNRAINSGFASHSPMMDALADELRDAFQGIKPTTPNVPFYSTVVDPAVEQATFDPQYWFRNIRQPVRFAKVVEQLLFDGMDIFIEMSPHPVLIGALRQSFEHFKSEATALPCARRDQEHSSFLSSLAQLHVMGRPINWHALYPDGGNVVSLPPYPFQRERFWLELGPSNGSGRADNQSFTGHPLLQRYIQPASQPGVHVFETRSSAESYSFLTDHRVMHTVMLPGAAVLEMAYAGATLAYGKGKHALEDVRFERAMLFPDEGQLDLQLVLTHVGAELAEFKLFSRPVTETSASAWTLHHRGSIRIAVSANAPTLPSPTEVQARSTSSYDGQESYRLRSKSYQFGPTMQTVGQVYRGKEEALGRLVVPANVVTESPSYHVHPALLDGVLQTYIGAVSEAPAELASVPVPVRIDRMVIHTTPDPNTDLWSFVRARPTEQAGIRLFDTYLCDTAGNVLVEMTGYGTAPLANAGATVDESPKDWVVAAEWVAKPLDAAVLPASRWLLFADSVGVGDKLAAQLASDGHQCLIVRAGDTYDASDANRFVIDPTCPEHFDRLMHEPTLRDAFPFASIVHLWSAGSPRPAEAVDVDWSRSDSLGYISVLYLVQALVRSENASACPLWLVTTGAQQLPGDTDLAIEQTPVWGFGLGLIREHAELDLHMLDVGLAPNQSIVESLAANLYARDGEIQIALRPSGRFVQRLRHPKLEPRTAALPQSAKRYDSEGEWSYRVVIDNLGILDTMHLRETLRHRPGPGEVEIQVQAAGLNFRDVLQAMGFAAVLENGNRAPLGKECAGSVVAVGDGVEHFAVGDDVIAFNPSGGDGLLSAFVTLPVAAVMPKPARLTMAEAATTFLAYLTAHYTLNELARLQPGERVLIHAASGGVGLAAINLARQAGAEIFATAGTDEKRQFLRDLGITHVFDSRSLSFAEQILDVTNGEGVDVVLNSLAGEFIPRSLSIVRPYGRFLEIGKRDIFENKPLGLGAFKHDIGFFSVDLTGLIAARPALARRLFDEVHTGLANGSMPALPVQAMPITDAQNAFRAMAAARHIGRLALTFDDGEIAAEAGTAIIRPNATYLITGGLRGLGLACAGWLADQGARHLVLLGRSAPIDETRDMLAQLDRQGVEVRIMQADVADGAAVARVLHAIETTMPPLRGIIHSAVVLDDGIAMRLTAERCATPMRAKRAGSWNLHILTRDMPLDFLLNFSSMATMLGSGGQSGYAAAGSFIDAIPAYRRSRGLPAETIAWQPWSEIGLAMRGEHLDRWYSLGWKPFLPEHGFATIEYVLNHASGHVGVARFDPVRWAQQLGGPAVSPMLADLLAQGDSDARKDEPEARVAIMDAPASQRTALVEKFLIDQVAGVVSCPVSRVDVHAPLNTFGIDSLMAVELSNRIKRGLGINIAVIDVLKGPTVRLLGTMCVAELEPKDEHRVPVGARTGQSPAEGDWEEGTV